MVMRTKTFGLAASHVAWLTLVGLVAAGSACAKRSKGLSSSEKESMKAHVLDDLPSDVTHKVDVNFEDKVHLLGWKAEPEMATPGSTVNFTLWWKKTGDLDADWKLFTHVTTDNVAESKGNLDCVGAIRQEKSENCRTQMFGPSDWEKGKVIVDTFSFNVPNDVTWTAYRFLTGVWKGDTRLQIKNKDSADDANRANVIALPTGVKAPEDTPKKTELPHLQAPKFGKNEIKLDGKLDEPAWKNAGFTGPFVSPGDGKTPSDHPVNAVAKLGWDDTNLYVGFVVDDKEPVAPFKATEKDPHLWEKSSAVELMVQPGDPGDNKDYYEIQVDTAGAVFDTHWDDYNTPKSEITHEFGHMDWSSGVKSGVTIAKGKNYTLDLAVPWASFQKPRTDSPPKPGDTWRINLYSFRDNQSQALAWSPILGKGNFHKSMRFGQVTFVLQANAAAPSPSSSAAPPAVGAMSGEVIAPILRMAPDLHRMQAPTRPRN
ncbi:MAG: hypothetical protein NVSMB1_04040 [Polyangiales bacterium]